MSTCSINDATTTPPLEGQKTKHANDEDVTAAAGDGMADAAAAAVAEQIMTPKPSHGSSSQSDDALLGANAAASCPNNPVSKTHASANVGGKKGGVPSSSMKHHKKMTQEVRRKK